MNEHTPQKSSLINILGKAIFIIGGIAVLVAVGLYHTPSGFSVVLIWTWVAIYRLQRWRSSSHEVSSQREGKAWHEQPEALAEETAGETEEIIGESFLS